MKTDSRQESNLMSLQDGISSLTKTSIGVGIIMLPIAISYAGVSPGLFILIMAGLISTMSLYLLSRLYELGKVNDYISLGSRCLGLKGEVFILVVQLLLLISPMTAFVKFNGIFIAGIAKDLGAGDGSIFVNTTLMTIASAILLIFPVTLIRDLRKLSFSSALGMIGVLYLVLLTILDYFYDFFSESGTVASRHNIQLWNNLGVKMITTTNTFLLSYLNQTSLLPLISSLKSPTESRKNTLIIVSQTIVMLFYALVALFGYLHFGDGIQKYPNILMAKTNIFYLICRCVIIVIIVVTFPLILYPTKLSLDWIYLTTTGSDKENIGKSNTRNLAYSILMISLSTILAILFTSVLDIFDIFIPFVGSIIMFSFPAICFLLYRKELDANQFESLIASIVLAVGLIFFFVGGPYCLFNFLSKV